MIILVLVFDFYKLTSQIHKQIQKRKINKRTDKIKYLKYFN